MSFMSAAEMTQSNSLRMRLVAAAAEQGIPTPDLWVNTNLWTLVSQPGWDDAWDYAKDTATADHNPDTGARPGVISDAMIHDAVVALKTAQAPA